MHRIYRGAVCNLSATDFESGKDGLFDDRRLRNPLLPIVHSIWSKSLENAAESDSEILQRLSASGPHQLYYLSEGDPFHRVHNGPLSSRAWVLQEQMLVKQKNAINISTVLTPLGCTDIALWQRTDILGV